jgi:two-component system response regulator DesR
MLDVATRPAVLPLAPPLLGEDPLPQPICVLVVNELEIVRWGFRVLLGSQPWVRRCLLAADRWAAEAMLDRYEPDVAIVDATLGEESGLDIVAGLHARRPALRTLVSSSSSTLPDGALCSAGVVGLLSTRCSAVELVRTVRAVVAGQPLGPIGTVVSRRLISPRERDVLAQIATGATNREIAACLHVSAHTVKQHSSSLYRKLGARNRAEAVQRGQRLGLIA